MKRWRLSADARRRTRPWLRPLAWLGMATLAYFVLRLLFARSVGNAGMFSPSGLGDPTALLLGLSVIALRLALLFVAPAVVAYGLATRLLRAMAGPPKPPVPPLHG